MVFRPYRRLNAVLYAHRWASGRDPQFYNYEAIGGDCTNFASQCIYAGTGVMNETPLYGWYYINANNKSPSWTGVEYIISIRDFGPGIPEAELPYVKQKFYKGSSRARGSGIGLAVCDEIVHLHGGQFDIANAAGGGAVVTIRLPLKRETEKEL